MITAAGPRVAIADARTQVGPVPGFGFEPGTSAAFAALTRAGRVVIGTFPQTNDQVHATMTGMSVAVVDPLDASFASIRIPTDQGAFDAGAGDPPTGGADYDRAHDLVVGASVGGVLRAVHVA